MSTPTQKSIFAIHGTSRSEVWAVGGDAYTEVMTNRCLILRYDGTSWKEVAAPSFAGTTYPLNSVWAIAPNDVWATLETGTFVAHYDGRAWELVSIPLPLEFSSSFRAVMGIGTNDLYFAGTHGQIVHRDRGVWKLEQQLESGSISFNIIDTLKAFDADHVFASGNWNQFYRRQPDGRWELIPVPAGGPFGEAFFAIGGTSPTNVYLMGIQSILHFDGTPPLTKTDYSLTMRRQWFAGGAVGDRMYGVGPNGVAHEFRFDDRGGGTLSALTVGGGGDLRMTLRGAVGCGSDGIVAYGFSHYLPDGPPLIYCEEGVFHRFPTLPGGMEGSTEVKSVVATGLRDVVIAWQNFGDFRRGIARWDGDRWAPMDGRSENAGGAVAIARSGTGRLHAAEPLRLLHWNGVDDWVVDFTLPRDQWEDPIETMAVRTDLEIYLGTRQGRIYRYDGTTARLETTPSPTARIVALTATPTEVYAVGEKGLAWRRVGSTWQRLSGIEAREAEPFTAMTAGAEGVFACQSTPGNITGGGLGRVWRFSGGTAFLEVRAFSHGLEGLALTGAGYLVGLTTGDFVVTRRVGGAVPTLQRLDSGTGWRAIGDTGLAIAAEVPLMERPMLAVQRIRQPAPFVIPEGEPGTNRHGEYWLVREDRHARGTAIPPLRLQFTYDPQGLPAPWQGASLALYRQADGVTQIPTIHDPAARTLSTRDPVDFSAWTVGPASGPPTPPVLLAHRTAGGGVVLSWPAGAEAYLLESAGDLGSTAGWVPVAGTPSVVDGRRTLELPAVGTRQFFRLRQSGAGDAP